MYLRFIRLVVREGAESGFQSFYRERVIPALSETLGCLFAGLLTPWRSDEHRSLTLWRSPDDARAYGPFDAAFLPINGARPLGGSIPDPGVPMVMNAEQAAAAAAALGARLAVPIHYGDVSTPEYVQDLDAVARFRAAAAARGVAVRVLEPGETLALA